MMIWRPSYETLVCLKIYFHSLLTMPWSYYNIMTLNVLDNLGHYWLYRVIEFRLKSMVKLYVGTQSYCQHHEQVIHLLDYFWRPYEIWSGNSAETGQWKIKLIQTANSTMQRLKMSDRIPCHGRTELPGSRLNEIRVKTVVKSLPHWGHSTESICTYCIHVYIYIYIYIYI
jgi:hypothetical protein